MAALAHHAGDFPDLAALTLPEQGLAGRDAALMHAIYDAAVRRWSTMEWLISVAAGRDARDLDPFVRAGLLAGAAQLLLLDRIPDHAAIDESVEWVKSARGKGAGGVVNAVLRKLCRLRVTNAAGERETRDQWTGRRDEIPLADGRALVLADQVLPEEGPELIAIATGVSSWLVRRWGKSFGRPEATRIAWHSVAGPPVIINASLAKEPVEFPLAAGGLLVLQRHTRAGHFCVEGPREALVQLLEQRRDLWVQDPSSSAAIESISDLRPSLVIDLCAGQGTKTRQLARTFPEARILATDTDTRRFETLSAEFAGSSQVRVVRSDEVEGLASGQADLVLLDVPCSNTGVLSRRIEARLRAGEDQLARLSSLQGEIMARAAGLISRMGTILYATCSIEAEENEQQMSQAIRRHGLVVSRQRRSLPTGGPGKAGVEHSDGSYSAVLSR